MLNNGSHIYISGERGSGKSFSYDFARDLYDNLTIQKVSKKIDVERVTYNPPATILHWSDGTKTVVKTSENDDYNPVFGYLVAYFQKHSGMTKTKFGKLCDKINKEFADQLTKKHNKKIKETEQTMKEMGQ